MPRNDQVAVHRNGHLDHGYDASLAPVASAASAWPSYDFTPEVVRSLMTYEKSTIPSASSHLVDRAALTMASDPHPATSFTDAPQQGQVTVRRAIKGMPKRTLPNAPAATLSERTKAWSRVPSALPSNSDRVPSKDQAKPSAGSKDAASAPFQSCDDAFRTHSLASQSLSQYFERLKVSARDQPQALPATQPSVSSQQQISPSPNGSSSFHPTTKFSFPTLPDRLTDEGFSRRERAAHLILICSQQANAEELSLCKRLSLPLRRDVSGIFQSKDREKPGEDFKAAGKHSAEERRGASADDNESVHSRDNAHDASDDDAEPVDVEDCRAAEFGNNKKKRKSSRFASPGPHSIDRSDESPQVHTLDPDPSAAAASYVVVPAESNTRNLRDRRALSDKTNTCHQDGRPATVQVASKPEGGPLALPKPPAVQQQPIRRPPPRQTIGDKHRAAIRQRMRIRLAPVLEQRRADRAQEHTRVEQGRHARILATDNQGTPEAETQADATPEKKTPPKRTSKAGKRAQAIRGGNSTARPLTIAEIRARAAGTGPSSTSSGTSPKSKAASVTNGRVASDSAKRDSSPSPPADSSSAVPTTSSVAKGHETTRISSHASDHRSSKTNALLRPTIAAPTSSYDFRMACNVTTRLREVRSSLDKATREISDLTAESGGQRGIVKALGETTYLPPSQKASSKAIEGARDDYLDLKEARPHLNGDSRSHQGGEQQWVTDSRIDKRNVTPSVTSSRPRGNAPTPTQQVRRPSPPAVPKAATAPTSKGKSQVPTARHSIARKPSTPSHKHGGACKHGHTQGTGSALFTDEDWICLFCEYELYYGAPPRMFRACKNRKKLVAKKAQVKSKAQAAIQGKSNAKGSGCTCHPDHDGAHDHCHHDHGSVSGSDGRYGHCDHHHDGYVPEKGRRGLCRDAPRKRDQHHHAERREAPRDRCDCGNSIHSSEFSDDDDKSHTSL